MECNQLDKLLRKYTSSEINYLKNPSTTSSLYKRLKKEVVRGKKIHRFHLESLNKNEIEISKDSRFTEVPNHVHTNVNINYIYSGKCTYNIDDKSITLQEGDVCIFDKDVVRNKQKIGENDIVMNISMSERFLSNNFLGRLAQQSIVSNFLLSAIAKNQDHDNFLIFRTKGNAKIIRLFNDLLCEYYDKQMYSREIIDSYLIIIFTELLRIYQDDSYYQKVQLSNDASGIIVDILRFIEKEYLDSDLTTIANHFSYHPKYLSFIIKRNTGKTFKEIQTSLKLKLACYYLVNTFYSVQDIAERVKISNLNFFYKKFKSSYQMTPKRYREVFRNNECNNK